MSFAFQIKSEICSNRPFCQRHKKSLAYGLLLFGKQFSEDSITLHTEHRVVARLYADSVTDLVGISDSITVREIKRADRRSVFAVTVDSIGDRIAVLSYFGYKAGEDCSRIHADLLPEAERPAFLSGVFLACGGVADPEKSYHVEFATPHKALCDDLEAFLTEHLSPPKATTRRNDYLLYYKESENMEDLLTYISAPKASLDLMEIKIVKELRNKVNRETNCETANISKTVDAAMTQIEDIRLIDSTCGVGALDKELQELARLRLQNPELSLRELGAALSEQISRSGVNHRLKRIAAFAEGLRKSELK